MKGCSEQQRKTYRSFVAATLYDLATSSHHQPSSVLRAKISWICESIRHGAIAQWPSEGLVILHQARILIDVPAADLTLYPASQARGVGIVGRDGHKRYW